MNLTQIKGDKQEEYMGIIHQFVITLQCYNSSISIHDHHPRLLLALRSYSYANSIRVLLDLLVLLLELRRFLLDLLVVVVELRRFLLDLLVLIKLSRRQRPKLRTLTPAASAAERLG